MPLKFLWPGACLWALLLGSCGEVGYGDFCEEGSLCACADGSAGTQTCEEGENSPGRCVCLGGDTGRDQEVDDRHVEDSGDTSIDGDEDPVVDATDTTEDLGLDHGTADSVEDIGEDRAADTVEDRGVDVPVDTRTDAVADATDLGTDTPPDIVDTGFDRDIGSDADGDAWTGPRIELLWGGVSAAGSAAQSDRFALVSRVTPEGQSASSARFELIGGF